MGLFSVLANEYSYYYEFNCSRLFAIESFSSDLSDLMLNNRNLVREIPDENATEGLRLNFGRLKEQILYIAYD